MSKREASFLKRFKEEKDGNVAITFGLMGVVMMGAIGAAVDMGRALHAQSRLQAAVDAAATAAAAAVSSTAGERTDIAKNFLASNNVDSFGGSPVVSVNVNGAIVSVTAESSVPAGVTMLLGVNRIPITASSEAGTTGKNLEVAMMIDVTGSMSATRGGMKKIDALKLAADDLLDIFFPNGATTSGQVRVGIAPMADYVNAGQYASQATGLPSTGSYANLTNLKSTKNGPFSGNHSGSYGTSAASQPVGSQQGATPINASVLPGQLSGVSAGQTYASSHCADPNLPATAVAELEYESTGKPIGFRVPGSGSAPTQLKSGNTGFYATNWFDNQGSDTGWELHESNDSSDSAEYKTSGYYIPIPESTAGVSYVKYGSTATNIGASISVEGSIVSTPQIKYGSYKRITGYGYGSFTYASGTTYGYYLPVPTSMQSGGGTDPNCTGADTAPDQNSGQLVSCVTERTGANAYTDENPGAGYIGAYNQTAPGKTTNKLNYSEDGKCYSAGRELPAIIPLTNSRTTLETFFTNATVGGSTPGHLGHAWAWYMLSPKWQTVWPQESHPAQYDDTGVMKAAIIMTDGEYNTQYSSETSRNQALALCQGMRDAGIQIYTIGFGFTSSADDTAAANMLKECVNNENGSYFFPYDATELRQAFKDIGTKLTGGASRLVVMK